jgi:hypothetical protein
MRLASKRLSNLDMARVKIESPLREATVVHFCVQHRLLVLALALVLSLDSSASRSR